MTAPIRPERTVRITHPNDGSHPLVRPVDQMFDGGEARVDGVAVPESRQYQSDIDIADPREQPDATATPAPKKVRKFASRQAWLDHMESLSSGGPGKQWRSTNWK